MSSRLLLLLPLVAGCTVTGNIQRAARVPHPGAPLTDGQPLDGAAELTAGVINLGDAVSPKLADASQAVEVTSTEMRDEARFPIGARGELAAIYELGFASTSRRPGPTQPAVGRGDVHGYGVAGRYSFETSVPGLAIGTAVELFTWSTPYVEYEMCTGDDCTSSETVVTHGRAYPFGLGLGVTPSYRTGPLTLFGGFTGRTHPTALREQVGDLHDGGNVEVGPFNLLVHAGAEIAIARWLSALVVVHQDLTSAPVRYGPGIGFALTGKLVGRTPRRGLRPPDHIAPPAPASMPAPAVPAPAMPAPAAPVP